MNRTHRITGIILAIAIVLASSAPLSHVFAADTDFVVDANGTLLEYKGTSGAVIIPSTVYYIADNAFSGKAFIKSVTFPDTIVSIGRYAFENCTGLTSVVIPNRVKTIQSGTFSGCTSLHSVTLHPYLETIGGEAFYDCPITSLEIPYSVRTIGISAFRNNRLTSLHIPSVNAITIGDFAFSTDGNVTLRGAAGSRVESYAKSFSHPFVAEPNNPPSAPPALAPLNLPPKTIKNDAESALPRYAGPGQPPANWAIQAVNYLYENTTIENEYFKDYSKGVDRAEAAYYMVHVYYAITGKPLDLSVPAQSFADTDSEYAALARELGLMNGTDAAKNLFAPNTILKREEITIILKNLLDKAGINYNTSGVDQITFADLSEAGSWAVPQLKLAYHLGLISGTTSANPPNINPKGTLDRQQLYQILWNLLISRNKIEKSYTRGEKIGQPKLVYSGVGRQSSGYMEEAYYSTPVVADVDKDGKQEIVYTASSVYCVDARTGTIKWQVPSGYDRSAPTGTKPLGFSFADVIVMDVDKDGELEIVVGHQVMFDEKGSALPDAQRKGVLAVYDKNGHFKPGWPKTLPRAINSVAAAADPSRGGLTSIVVGLIGETALDALWMFDQAGNVLSGWPQLNNSTWAHTNTDRSANTGYVYGYQGNTIAIGDIDGSGRLSVVAPTDLRHIPVLDMLGNLVKANPVFSGTSVPRAWGRIGTWLDYDYEKLVENEGFGFNNQIWSAEANGGKGGMVKVPWEDVPLEKRLFANFMQSPAVITDVDGNGTNEIVIIGTINDEAFLYPDPPLFQVPFIFNGDRTRFKTDQYDWTSVPTDAGPIHNFDYREIILPRLLPVVSDVNDDGVNEILYNSASGKVMCYSLDKQFVWSYWVNDKDNFTVEHPSPVVTYDLNNNGFDNIIFATNTPKESSRDGRLIILDFKGTKLAEAALPKALGAPGQSNGVVAQPVVVDLDGDGKPYIILNTHLSGLTVYKMT